MKFDKWHHKNPTKVHDAEQNLNGPLIVWGVMFHPIWMNINSENIQRKIRADKTTSLCISVSFCNDSCNDSLCFVDLRQNAHDFPSAVGAEPKISPRMFTLLSTERHKCILSSVRDIFHFCFKVWTLNPKHTLPFFHARTNSHKSDSIMRCCLTCMQHLCKPFGMLQKQSQSGWKNRERKRERLSCELFLKPSPLLHCL